MLKKSGWNDCDGIEVKQIERNQRPIDVTNRHAYQTMNLHLRNTPIKSNTQYRQQQQRNVPETTRYNNSNPTHQIPTPSRH